LANARRQPILVRLACVGWLALWLLPAWSHAGLFSPQARRYGPSTPSGYRVRVEPSAVTLSHSKRQPIEVTIENEAGQPIDGVTVQFRASEGNVATDTHETRRGTVTGTFAVAAGSDQPRTVFVVVMVENVKVTVFIDIVPAVFGR
ncbi:MAG: hypothetical protein OEU26_29245, partial [Candidatus Tectomicrobia bacterium]|nr:hypothetical protein [Candidatus Tectomicrobia bacterium]